MSVKDKGKVNQMTGTKIKFSDGKTRVYYPMFARLQVRGCREMFEYHNTMPNGDLLGRDTYSDSTCIVSATDVIG